jgi:hypothetical protein
VALRHAEASGRFGPLRAADGCRFLGIAESGGQTLLAAAPAVVGISDPETHRRSSIIPVA